MSTDENKVMEELALTLATIRAAQGDDMPINFVFTRNKIATLRPSERMRVVVIREHDEPQHPLFDSAMREIAMPVMG